MGIRVTGVSEVAQMLENVSDKTNKPALRIMREGAKDIRDLARERAPLDEGNLEEAINVPLKEDRGGIHGRIRIYVEVDESMSVPGKPGKTVGDYAARMHEGVYNLGKGSQEKADKNGQPVGRKFLESAAEELEPIIGNLIDQAIGKIL